MENFPRFDLTGHVALVTGAARGLGRSIALAIANAGADVVLGLRDESSGQGLVGEIREMGRRAIGVQMDVLNLNQVTAGVATAVAEFGRIDILVNNAGLGPSNPAIDATEADFDLTFDVNVKGTFFVSQAAARVMVQNRYGRIINLSSQAGFVALPGESIYCASKAAISHLTKCLAVEWGGDNITVNSVAPTFIETPGTEAALADDEFRADVEDRIAGLHRIGRPEDVTGAIIFLASPAAALVTGTTLMVDGGWTAR
jgi:NAD(P)-dependent dehydrogenase (short-subunit alcohol dehydrogenase family)